VLLIERAWTWPVPVGTRAGFGAAVCTVAVLLALAAHVRGYQAAGRAAAAASVILLALDVGLLGYISGTHLVLASPVPLAMALSVARIGFTLRRLPQLLACC
jgi:hypothetical protein